MAQLKPIIQFVLQPLDLVQHITTATLKADVIAGLTVAVIAIPQAMAYALIAELPPEAGLYAAIIGAVVGALWGSSHHLQTGPTNTTSLLVLSVLLTVASPNDPNYLVIAGIMAMVVGIIQILLALARLGVLVNFISDAVIVGFTGGAGILIAINQVRNLLRLDIPSMPHLWETLPHILGRLETTHIPSLLIGIGAIALIVILRKVNPDLPAPLLGMVGAGIVVGLFRLDQQGVAVVGELPRGLPPLAVPRLSAVPLGDILTGALAVAAIGLVESISIARSIASQTNQRLDSNQEFFGQGLANVASGLFGGYPIAGSFTRSAVNHSAGASTALSSLFASLFVLIAILALGPLAAYVPQPALAGVIMVTAYGLIEREEMERIWRSNHGDRTIMAVTFLATLALPLEYAVLAGIGLSLIYYLLKTSKPRVRVVLPSNDFRYFTPRPNRPSCTQLGVIEILGDLYFGAVSHIEEKIQENLDDHPTQRYLLLRMYPVENCDISGIHALESIVRLYRDHGGDVYFVHVQDQVRQLMESTAFYDYVGSDHFLDPDEAVSRLFHRVLDPAICIYECPVRVFRYCQNLPKRLDLACPMTRMHGERGVVTTVRPETLWESLHQRHPPQIIDVREPREYQRAHIPEARRIGFHSLLEDPNQVPRDAEVVLVCQGGRRSRHIASLLIEEGYHHIRIVEGGMQAWRQQQLLTAVEFHTAPTSAAARDRSDTRVREG
jgi:SulP family sulfate permease